jgi:predicted dehydrogenase
MAFESAFNRRSFLRGTAVGTTLVAAASVSTHAFPILGANDRLQVGFLGIGIRGSQLLKPTVETMADKVRVVAVCDGYTGYLQRAVQTVNAACGTDPVAYGQFRKMLDDKNVEAVVIATPEHRHVEHVLMALAAGKDVYVEKPLSHSIEEGPLMIEAQKKSGRIVQVGTQRRSSLVYQKAREMVKAGMLGKVAQVRAFWHRNTLVPQWRYAIPTDASPQTADWEAFLGPAPKRPWDASRYFQWRLYWDYSGGIATDLFYHVMAPLNLVWGGGEFPWRVVATGGIYVFKDEREVPDTFMLTADYPSGHSVVLSSSMANSTHIPGLIRGHDGTIMMVENGQFESHVDHITVTPQKHVAKDFEAKYGGPELKIMVEPRATHYQNFVDCVRSREKPVLDGLTAYKAMTTIAMSVDSYRRGQMLYFDRAKQKVTDKPTPRPQEGE